ncbi:MAG: AAA family ATPase [Patescibacteria group bacterium]
MPKIILGFVGEMASGKGTVVSYIQEKYGAATYSFSTMLRDMLDRLYLPHTRDNMIDLSVWVRGHFGEDVMARTMANDIEKDPHDIVAVEGIRRPADIEY